MLCWFCSSSLEVKQAQILMQPVKLQRCYNILHKCRGSYISPLPYNFSSLCLHVAKFEDAVYCVYIERQKQNLPVHVHCSCCEEQRSSSFQGHAHFSALHSKATPTSLLFIPRPPPLLCSSFQGHAHFSALHSKATSTSLLFILRPLPLLCSLVCIQYT